MTCPETAPALGAYVLGDLDPADRRRVEDHVRGCPSCAAELAEFQTLPRLLDMIGPDDVQAVPVAPSSDLFERVSAAAAAERDAGRDRRRVLIATAAVIVLLGAGAGVTSWVLASGEETRSVVAGTVRMTVTASEQGDGTSLDVIVAGVPARANCTLVVIDRNGDRHKAGEWSATYEGEAWFKGWSDVDRSEVEDVVLLGTGGEELVRVPL